MNIDTVAGRIVLEGGSLRCESRRTLGSAFMLFGMAFIAFGTPIMVVSAFPQGLAVIPLVALWMTAVWYWAGGRFGTFVIDSERRELRTDDGTVLAPLDQVRFFTVFDMTDGTNFWTGRNHWLTASAPGFTHTYRLGKMSREDASRVLEKLRGWGCRAG